MSNRNNTTNASNSNLNKTDAANNDDKIYSDALQTGNRVVQSILDGIDEDSDSDTEAKISASESFYNKNGKTLKVLLAMGFGLLSKDNGGCIVENAMTMLRDIKISVSEFKPSVEIMRAEILRRCVLEKVSSEDMPRPGQYTYKKCQSWLGKHPLKERSDVSFVTQEIERNLTDTVKRCKNDPKDIAAKKGSPWLGEIPYLRLMYVLVENDIKELFIKRYYKNELVQVDSKQLHMATFLKAAADRWNDPTFNPITSPRPELHAYFTCAVPLNHSLVAKMMKADEKRVNDVLGSLRGKLIEITNRYNLSGAGCDKGKAAFLGSFPIHLLYYWELMDEHDMLTSAVQVIQGDSAAASAEDTMDVFNGRRGKKSLDTTGMENAIASVGKSNSASIMQFADVIKTSSENETKAKIYGDNRAYLVVLEERLEKNRIETREIEHELDKADISDSRKRRLENHHEENLTIQKELKEEITALKDELKAYKK